MAEKAKKNNKNLIIGICTGILIIAIVIVAVIFATKSTAPSLNDDYFVSDDTKYVLTIDDSMINENTENSENGENSEDQPIKTHVVYEYSGDQITKMTTYMEYADTNTAKASLERFQNLYNDDSLNENNIESMSVNGKYLVIASTEDGYAGKTASDVKEEIDFIEMLKKTNLNDLKNVEETSAPANENQ